jgi:chromosome segregation ATPase
MFRTIVRVGVIGMVTTGVLTGGALLIAGPQRAKAVIHKVKGDLLSEIDSRIDDPTALRGQLEDLEREYPARIKQVRTDLAEINEQIRQLRREQGICERVVAMADTDLSELEPKIREAAAVQASNGHTRAGAIALDDRVYSFERAAGKANQIRHTRVAYSNRAADAAHDLTYLDQQAVRLQELLVQLENERAQFQAQIWQLSRQVDAIARNERLIELVEKRNRTIEECSRYDAISLDQITSRLSEIRSRQEAELDLLASARAEIDYEERARSLVLRGHLEGVSAPHYPRGSDIERAAGSRRALGSDL